MTNNKQAKQDKQVKPPRGLTMAVAVALGVGFGVTIGVATDNLATWTTLGCIIGVVYGVIMSRDS